MPVTREEKKDPMRLLFPDLPVLKSTRLLLRPLEMPDAQGLLRLTRQEKVYRFLPTYLFEKQFDDIEAAIRGLYRECLEDSLILYYLRSKMLKDSGWIFRTG